MIVAIIPARGGSKRVPRKNIREFHGRPMIAWPIEAAKRSGCFDRIIVSTDDEEIAKIALAEGVEVPFLRPAELSDDFTGTVPVIAHAVEWLQAHGAAVRVVCCIYPTAAFLDPEALRRGGQELQESGADYAFTVAPYRHPIERALRIDARGRAAVRRRLMHREDVRHGWEYRDADRGPRGRGSSVRDEPGGAAVLDCTLRLQRHSG